MRPFILLLWGLNDFPQEANKTVRTNMICVLESHINFFFIFKKEHFSEGMTTENVQYSKYNVWDYDSS